MPTHSPCYVGKQNSTIMPFTLIHLSPATKWVRHMSKSDYTTTKITSATAFGIVSSPEPFRVTEED